MTRTLRLFEGIGIELELFFSGGLKQTPSRADAGPSPASAERFARGPIPA
jgi:hypothetical protein